MKKLKPQFLRNDIIFKNVFITEERIKKLLESSLNIKVNKILIADNNEMNVENIKERKMFLDLIVYTDDGIINVEVNNNYKEELFNRNLLYFCKLISSNLKQKEEYTNIVKHIQLNLTWNLKKYLGYDISDKKILKFYITENNTSNKIYNDIFEIVHINMDYFDNKWYNKKEDEEDPFMMLLSAKTYEEMDKISKGDELMVEISNKVKYLNLDPDVAKELVIENEAEKWANQRYSTGLKQGIEQGIEQGSLQTKIETAKKMFSKGMKIEDIIDVTGLSKQELKNL